MDSRRNYIPGGSPSSSSSAASSPNPTTSHNHHSNHHNHHDDTDPIHSWWESVSKARSRIQLLSSLLPASSLSSLADSDNPALSLLSSQSAYSALSSSLSGNSNDPLCHWLYDTYQSSDPHLQLLVLSFIPLISSLYLSILHSLSSPSTTSLAGFEAVLLSLYASETKSRNGKPVVVSIPDLSLPSLYHTPKSKPNPNPNLTTSRSRPSIGVISPPLEPQIAVKSTKRATIVGVALDCYYKQISQMPTWSKLDFCRFAADWAGQDCPCRSEFDERNQFHEIVEEMDSLEIIENGSGSGQTSENGSGSGQISENGSCSVAISENGSGDSGAKNRGRIPLPWELLQPVLRILGHCLLAPLNGEEIKDAAAVAVRCLYARANHELVPQAILATRSLIQLDKRAREAARAAVEAAAAANVASNSNTPTKAKKPEILLVSK